MFSAPRRSTLEPSETPTFRRSATKKWRKTSRDQTYSTLRPRATIGRSLASLKSITTSRTLSRLVSHHLVSRALVISPTNTSRITNHTSSLSISRCRPHSQSTTRRSSTLLRRSMRSTCSPKLPEPIDPRQAPALSLPSSTLATRQAANPRFLFTDMQTRWSNFKFK